MRHLAYSVRISVVPIDSSLLTITLYSSVSTTLVYNDTNVQSPSWHYNRVRFYVTVQIGSNSPHQATSVSECTLTVHNVLCASYVSDMFTSEIYFIYRSFAFQIYAYI